MKGKKKKFLALGLALAALFTASLPVCADTAEGFQSKGAICFDQGNGERVVLDAGDLDVLFQYAAEGKNAVVQALGGVGTRLCRTETGFAFVRDDRSDEPAAELHSFQELAVVSFPELMQAVADSQKIPAYCEESCTLATPDNITLGRAGWSDGSLTLGNNHDLIQSYLRGWREAKEGKAQKKELPPAVEPEGQTYGELLLELPGEAGICLNSRGSIRYQDRTGTCYLSAGDLRQTEQYLESQKEELARRLRQTGTALLHTDNGAVCTGVPEREGTELSGTQLSWQLLGNAIRASQQIPAGIAVAGAGRAMQIEGTGERTDTYGIVGADHISLGKGVWMDGVFVVGNGRDNERAYQRGIRDEEEGKIPDNFLPVYRCTDAGLELKHTHQGKAEKKEGISGCYQNSVTKKTEACGSVLTWAEPSFRENEEEEGGGSWHGGFYYCVFHGGTLPSSGTCKEPVEKKDWSHKLICGIDDKEDSYAKLLLSGEDRDPADGRITLTAHLESGSLYEQLAWDEGAQFVWYDSAEQAIGEGAELQVDAAGTYICSVCVQNEDIPVKRAQVTVEVADLVLQEP